ncbi:tRNA epoxyqueuosine(34) reductase QueG [Tepidicaulis sp. LMO-SS28]|uniref:tRNA epoxyqueuosine(34) reductase QueG n=1 Tax=Tepidicaulis sp. LMO-SS28 TaxID=3447455 RepID=UPI003EDEFD89
MTAARRQGPIKEPLETRIKQAAREAGFDIARFVSASRVPDRHDALARWVGEGKHGQMGWMEDTLERRGHPASLWGDVKSILVLGQNYGPEEDPLAALERKDEAAISVYARHKDYHDLIKKRLKRVARWLVAETGCEVKVFVDTAPVMEKPLAEAAGLGWQGKHTNLVSREFGSWLFLGSIFTTLDLAADEGERDHCGSCRSCLDICPTKAFPAPYQLDARRCISYLTIEHKGVIPLEFRKPMGNRIYGCDDCLAVCPWNKFAARTAEEAFHTREALRAPLLKDLARLDDASFRTMFSGSPVKRIGRTRFLRNVLIAIGNSGDVSLLPEVKSLLEDEAPEVRAMAVWALGELGTSEEVVAEKERLMSSEEEADVLAEWARIGG